MDSKDIKIFMVNIKTMRQLQKDYDKTRCQSCLRSKRIMESLVDEKVKEFFK